MHLQTGPLMGPGSLLVNKLELLNSLLCYYYGGAGKNGSRMRWKHAAGPHVSREAVSAACCFASLEPDHLD